MENVSQEYLNMQRLAQLRNMRRLATVPNAQPQEKDEYLKFYKKILKICIALDLIEFFTAGTIGWVTGTIGDIYLWRKIGRTKGQEKQFRKILVAVLGEKIPVVNVLPLRTIMWILGKNKA